MLLFAATAESPTVITTPIDYSSQLAQANILLANLISEIQNHATQNGSDLSDILSQLQVFQSAATTALNTLSDKTGILQVGQEQIRELLNRIYGYLPNLNTEIENFKSATLFQLDVLGASIGSKITEEGDQTQSLLVQISDQLSRSQNPRVTSSDLKRIETGATWKKLNIPEGLIQYVLGCVSPGDHEYFFQESGRELKLMEATVRINKIPQGGNNVYGSAVAELPPQSVWLFSCTSYSPVAASITEQDGTPAPDILVEIPSELVP